MNARIVYTTDTVTIDYNQTLRLFLTEKEQRPFSAERIVQMLNGWAKVDSINTTLVGLHIAAGEVHCVLTQQAWSTLSLLYCQHSDWQIEYPYVSAVLGGERNVTQSRKERKNVHDALSSKTRLSLTKATSRSAVCLRQTTGVC